MSSSLSNHYSRVKSVTKDGRLKYQSSKQRSKRASADVLRKSKNERDRVHRDAKRQRKLDDGKDPEVSVTTTFAEELDLCSERNASEKYGTLYRELWPLSRSLPEVLHHLEAIVNGLCGGLITDDGEPTHATLDTLHLLSVLARDMRSELSEAHLRRIFDTSCALLDEDVNIVEAMFRSWAYIADYAEVENELLRQNYYGRILGHSREIVRRLGAEMFSAPLRKLHDKARRKFLGKVLKAFVAVSRQEGTSQNALQNVSNGIAQLCFYTGRGIAGKLNKKGHLVVKWVLEMVHDSDTIFQVAVQLVEYLLNHLHNVEPVWCELISLTGHSPSSVRLVQQVVRYRSGKCLKGQDGVFSDDRLDDLINLIENKGENIQPALVDLACVVWKTVRTHPALPKRIGPLLSEIVQSQIHLATVVAKDLLPHASLEGLKSLGPALLRVASLNEDLGLVFAMATSLASASQSDTDSLFGVGISVEAKSFAATALLDSCCAPHEDPAGFAFCLRCMPLLLSCAPPEKKHETMKWFLETLKKEDDAVVVGLCLEAFSAALEADASPRYYKRAIPIVEALVQKYPHSLSVIKGCSRFIGLDSSVSLWQQCQNEIMESLVVNLRSRNHFMRKHTLEILVTFPKRPYIVDHDDLDLWDDLDEEHSGFHQARSQSSSSLSGLCDLLDTLLELECAPITFSSERQITSILSRVEVMGRAGRLPIIYAEAASNFCLGLLEVKFSPFWAASIKALQALAKHHDAALWEALITRLNELLEPVDVVPGEGEGVDPSAKEGHYRLLQDWEFGKSTNLFAGQIEEAKRLGKVSRHLNADHETVLENVMKVLEGSPDLTAKKSRHIVPTFLKFLHSQYYCFHTFDPDARELRLGDHVERNDDWTADKISRKALHNRLLSFLRTFAAINGPKQLYKHRLLLQVFTALLSHQERRISQLSLDCLLKFKLPHATPYAEHLKKLLTTGELREAILNFEISSKADCVHKDHRQGLVPILTRIAFGRMTSKESGRNSAHDSPAARRTAVLSFLSRLDKGEFSPLVYLMLRNYLPQQALSLHPLETVTDIRKFEKQALESLQEIESETLLALPTQRHEGFLNLLSSCVSQLGYSLLEYVPSLMSVLLSLTKFSAIGSSNVNSQVIRSSCFRCISEMMEQFGNSVDFRKFSARLWDSIGPSIEDLPAAAVSGDKVPSLLRLFESISSSPKLLVLLADHKASVQSVIKCIAKTSSSAVMVSLLNFISNLLTNGGSELDDATEGSSEHLGTELIIESIPLLVVRFSNRFGGEEGAAEMKFSHSQTMWSELSILCRVCNVLLSSKLERSIDSEAINSLSLLLMPFLGHPKAKEEDQLNVLGVVSVLVPMITSEVALSNMEHLSRLLGARKHEVATQSLLVRRSIASVIENISNKEGVPACLREIADALRNLCAMHSKKVDEVDYEVVLGTLNSLSDSQSGRSWGSLVSEAETVDVIKTINPLVQVCFALLCSDDGVVARAAAKSLKALLQCCGDEVSNNKLIWAKFAESSVIPFVRQGLNHKADSKRKSHIMLLAEAARCFQESASPHLYGDLHKLSRDDNSDLDFFLNATHVQIHRKSRAFQRLRDMLNDTDGGNFSMHSLSNVLLPIAMFPVYESKTKLDEPLALEGVATVGAIARHLSWSKYHSLLWTTLTQVRRMESQERYLIGAVCSIIDGFHFKLFEDQAELLGAEDDEGPRSVTSDGRTSVWKALESRFIPKLEGLMTKEKVDARGMKRKVLRPTIVLALLKLYQNFPQATFESKLPRLLAVICDSLKSRDISLRDVARTTLAKMAVFMDMRYLSTVYQYLALALKEGYQLHVRSAALHSILLELSEKYQPRKNMDKMPPFDEAIPSMLDLIYQDLFGEASEHKDVEGVRKQYSKEAKGSKSFDSIETVSRLLYFKPDGWGDNGAQERASSVHAVVSPLLEKLRVESLDTKTIGRIRECLNRIVVGLSRNPTVCVMDALPFVCVSVKKFVGDFATSSHVGEEESSDEEGAVPRIRVSGATRGKEGQIKSVTKESTRSSVVVWRPSESGSAKSAREAKHIQSTNTKSLKTVQDGMNAPKLTGTGRHNQGKISTASGLGDPASACAVMFSLNLLHSVLKHHKVPQDDPVLDSKLDLIVMLLSTCVCGTRNNEILLVSLRSLQYLLRRHLPSIKQCRKKLSGAVLELLSSSGSVISANQELSRAAFKALTLLIQADNTGQTPNGPNSIPLNLEQMDVLVSILQSTVSDADNFSTTTALIKALVARRFMSADFYDLMDSIRKLTVQSPSSNLRQQCGTIFLQYLLSYPMAKQKLQQYLREVVLDLEYPNRDGRMSAIELVAAIVEKFPFEALDEHAQLLFLPLVLQLTNDDSSDCHEAASKCLGRLICRVSNDVTSSLFDYTTRWSRGEGRLRQTSLQLIGIFVESAAGFVHRPDTVDAIVSVLEDSISDETKEWERLYLALVCFFKLFNAAPQHLTTQKSLWVACVKLLCHKHPWVKLAASRVLNKHLTGLDPGSFGTSQRSSFVVQQPGTLFEIARNLCTHLDADESDISNERSLLVVKSMVWILQAMRKFPDLCFSGERGGRDPVRWCLTRLCNVAKPKGEKRREAVFKCFAAFCSVDNLQLGDGILEIIIEPIYRSINESENVKDASGVTVASKESDLAKEVLHLIEESCDSSESFLLAYAAVKSRAREKREKRKEQLALEAVTDPGTAVSKRMKKQDAERRRRKRKVEERRDARGGKAKRHHL